MERGSWIMTDLNDYLDTDCSECKVKDKIIEELTKQLKEMHKLHIQGWKGKDELEFIKAGDDWTIIEHRREKGGEVKEQKHTIPKENVKVLWTLILNSKENKLKYRELVEKLIEYYELEINKDEFNGGHNRARYYFPYYYFPVKILEKLEYINYGGRGTITRLK